MAGLNILLLTDAPSQVLDSTSGLDVVGQLLLPIFYFVLVCTLAYFTTKWLASSKGIKGKSFSKNSKISVSDTLYLGYQKSLQLVKVGDKHFLLAVTKDDIRFLSEVSSEEFMSNTDKDFQNINASDLNEHSSNANLFDKYLKQFISKK